MNTNDQSYKLTQPEIDEISTCQCCRQQLPAEVLAIRIEQRENVKLTEQLRRHAEKLQAAELQKIRGKITVWSPITLILVWTVIAIVICLILVPQDPLGRTLDRDDMRQLYTAVVAGGTVWFTTFALTVLIWPMYVWYNVHKLDKSFRQAHPTLVGYMTDWEWLKI